MSEPIRYEIDLRQRLQHLVTVTMYVPPDLGPSLRLLMPTWTPGSYVIRDYVHHLQWIRAEDAAGRPVPLHDDGRTAWTLERPDGATDLVVTWELYANQLTVRTNHVDDHHALLVAPATFVVVEAARDRVHEVTFRGTDPVWSLLPPGDDDRTFVAGDRDHLIDSAFEVGEHPNVATEVAGAVHRFVWSGHGGKPDLDRIAGDMKEMASACTSLFDGDLPSRQYTFINVGWDNGGGGLEHRDGSVLMMPVHTFQDEDTYARFQSLMAHEYLHLWNVKRLTPSELVRPDPIAPTHTRLLWVAEGWTSYYDELVPLRAGCWTLARYLKAAASQLDRVLLQPGTAYQSVEEASHHAWTKQYVRDENWVNAGTDYYGHGAVLAWSLDLLIRRERPEGDGLDEAVRDLWRRHGNTDQGYTSDDVRAAVARAAGTDLGGFFDRHVAGRELPPIDDLVGIVGLEVSWPDPEGGDVPYLGVDANPEDGRLMISAVRRGSPAWDAGVTGRDELLAIDGTTVAPDKLTQLVRAHAPGDTVTLAVRRGPRLLELDVVLGDPVRARVLSTVAEPTTLQAALFERWTAQPFPS